jgi:hypothetical protein
MRLSCRSALRALGLAAVAVVCNANAAVTIWEFEGQITVVDEKPGFDPYPDEFVVGMPFKVKIEFDTAAPLSGVPQPQGTGLRYNYNNVDSLRFNIYLGETCNPCVPQGSHNIIVRDDAAFPPPAGPAVDGYSFGVTTPDGQQIGLFMRGPVLDVVRGGALPESPDPRLADLELSVFQVCDANANCVFGDIASVKRRSFRTTWEVQGTIDSVRNSAELGALLQPGERFRILVDFDTQTVQTRDPRFFSPGTRYDHSARTLSYRIYVGDDGPFDQSFDVSPGAGGGIIVRDDAANPSAEVVDGFSFGLLTLDTVDEADPSQGRFFSDVGLVIRGPVLDIVDGEGIAAVPDTRLGSAAMSVRMFQVCRWRENESPAGCPFGEVLGTIDSVTAPAFGTRYVLSARDCERPTSPSDSFPDDCISQGFPNGLSTSGGGLGRGEFVEQFAPASPWSGAGLGSAFGSVSFSGPVTLPVVKGQSLPSAVSRNNANAQAFQLYRFEPDNPRSLPIPLVIDLTYKIGDYSDPAYPVFGNQTGLRPGGAQLSTLLAIVDGDRVPTAAIALADFNSLRCGGEGSFQMPDGSAWPAGSIMGTATFSSPQGQRTLPGGLEAATIPVDSCASPGSAPQLAPGQRFVVVTSMQSPARGAKSAVNAAGDAAGDGYVDSANTLKVKLDPAAPPALLQALADSIEPECVDCGFVTDVLGVAVDLKPGSADNCVNAGSSGVVPVALLGAAGFDVRSVRQDGSLRLGAQGLRVRGNRALCSVSSVNGDGFDDLVCNFENAASNWVAGQSSVTVTGQLADGTPFEGTDRVCVVK